MALSQLQAMALGIGVHAKSSMNLAEKDGAVCYQDVQDPGRLTHYSLR
jgi:hypothetical protein